MQNPFQYIASKVTELINLISGFRSKVLELQRIIAARDLVIEGLQADNAKLKADLAQEELDDAALESIASNARIERDRVQSELNQMIEDADKVVSSINTVLDENRTDASMQPNAPASLPGNSEFQPAPTNIISGANPPLNVGAEPGETPEPGAPAIAQVPGAYTTDGHNFRDQVQSSPDEPALSSERNEAGEAVEDQPDHGSPAPEDGPTEGVVPAGERDTALVRGVNVETNSEELPVQEKVEVEENRVAEAPERETTDVSEPRYDAPDPSPESPTDPENRDEV